TKMSQEPRKRSKTLTAAFSALALVGAVALAGCQDENKSEVKQFKTVEACTAATDSSGNKVYSQAECQKAFDQAKAEHQQYRPRYESKADCEAEFGVGQCEPLGGTSVQQHHSSFGPLFLWYMIGYHMGSNNHRVYNSAPIYRTKSGSFQTATGTAVKPGKAPTSIFNRPSSKPVVIKKGGSISNPTAKKPSYTSKPSSSRSGGFGRSGRSFGGRSFGG
ncbi:MAG: DUF1190 domain-containing protein, partial [Chloroflexi bacterium]|nr:DUF1190 domain-containing protein [Chloroflexota bacterium]